MLPSRGMGLATFAISFAACTNDYDAQGSGGLPSSGIGGSEPSSSSTGSGALGGGDPAGGMGGLGGSGGEGGRGGSVPLPAGMVAVPGGTFMMGCRPDDAYCQGDEAPYHSVTLSGYAIDATEVTQAAFGACVDAGICEVPSCDVGWDPVTLANYPVTCMRRGQAMAYCTWALKRLPTEAEWERAARGDDGRFYPWGDEPPDCLHANHAGCVGTTLPVGSVPTGASPYGILDMAGNAWEWVSDHYDPTYYATSPASDPTGPPAGPDGVLRGGDFITAWLDLRTSNREQQDQNAPTYLPGAGFRCAVTWP